MAWTQTSATDIADLLTQFRAYLLANGWASGGADIVTSSDGYKFRVKALTSVVRNAYPFTDPDLPDHIITVEFDQTVLSPGYVPQYSLTNVGGSLHMSNDFTGPFANVWFFTDGKFAHIAAQVASSRYSHLSFGSLDDRAMHGGPKVGYIAGLYYSWWRTSADHTPASGNNGYYPNDPSNGNGHFFGHLPREATCAYAAVPDGVADPLLDFADGPIFDPALFRNSSLINRWQDGKPFNDAAGYLLDILTSIENKAITAGVPLFAVPWIMFGADNANMWLGEMPNFRFCKMNGLNPAQTISYAGEDWIVFPIKQIGAEEATRYGTNPQPDVNTAQYGFAYKKA